MILGDICKYSNYTDALMDSQSTVVRYYIYRRRERIQSFFRIGQFWADICFVFVQILRSLNFTAVSFNARRTNYLIIIDLL